MRKSGADEMEEVGKVSARFAGWDAPLVEGGKEALMRMACLLQALSISNRSKYT